MAADERIGVRDTGNDRSQYRKIVITPLVIQGCLLFKYFVILIKFGYMDDKDQPQSTSESAQTPIQPTEAQPQNIVDIPIRDFERVNSSDYLSKAEVKDNCKPKDLLSEE